MKGYKKLDLVILFFLIVLQLCVCIPFLDSYPIELDEPFTIYYSSQPLGETLNFLSNGNNPPLHYILQHFWQSLFGVDPLAVRSMSLLISLFLISSVYLFVSERSNYLIGFGAVGILMFTDSFHHFSMEARMFQLFILFSFLSLTSLYKWVFEENNRSSYFTAIFIALAIYTHYLGIFALAILVLLGLMNLAKIQGKQILKSALLFLILISPILLVIFSRGSDFVSNGSWIPYPRFVDFYEELFKMFNTPFNLIFFTLFLIALRVLVVKGGKKDSSFFFFLTAGLGLFVLMFLFSLAVQPVFHERYLFVSMVFFLPIFIWFGKVEFKWSFVKYLVPGVCLPFLFSVHFAPDINRETNLLIDEVKEGLNDGKSVYYCPEHYELLLAYHLIEDFESLNKLELNERLISEKIIADCAGERVLSDEASEILYIDFNSEFTNQGLNTHEVLSDKYLWIEETGYKGGFMLKSYKKK